MVNLTILNQTIIQPLEGAAYIPFEIYAILVGITLICFFGSIWIRTNEDINAILAAVMFWVLAALTPFVEFVRGSAVVSGTDVIIVPYSYNPYDPYIVWFWVGFALVGILNVYRIWHIKMVESVEKKQNMEEREFMEERKRRMI